VARAVRRGRARARARRAPPSLRRRDGVRDRRAASARRITSTTTARLEDRGRRGGRKGAVRERGMQLLRGERGHHGHRDRL
jgi:hypothetical protein